MSCDNAIYNFELAIPDAKKILEMYDENLSTLKTQRKRITDISSLLSWNKKPEETSEALSKELIARFVIPAASSDRLVKDQIDSVTDKARNLLDKIRQLEMELDMWTLSRNFSSSH